MNYAGATKALIQCTSVCTQTDMSWVGAQPVTRKQRPAASVTSRPVPSVSRSVGTTTRVADVKKTVAPAKSSPKKDPKSSKPSSPKVCLDQESAAAYFTVKTHTGKSKENSPVTSVHISPIKFKESILNKERLKRSHQASDFLPETKISPSRSEIKKHKVKKVDKNMMFSDVHKQRPRADYFFGDDPQYSNQTDVSLTSASDLETHVKNKGTVKKNIIRLPVDLSTGFCFHLLYILYINYE